MRLLYRGSSLDFPKPEFYDVGRARLLVLTTNFFVHLFERVAETEVVDFFCWSWRVSTRTTQGGLVLAAQLTPISMQPRYKHRECWAAFLSLRCGAVYQV